MRQTIMRDCLKYLIVCFFWLHIGNAQDTAKTHVVTKGESIYQISRFYKVSATEIMRLNPGSGDLIYVGDTLILPASTPSFNDGNLSYYIVKQGETKFGLSRQYGITIEELERQNPHIINGLQAGHRLTMSNAKVTTAQESFENNLETYNGDTKSYYVKKGETLYGISRANGITVAQLRGMNRDIITGILQANSYINIPSDDTQSDSTNTNVYVVKKDDTKYSLSKKFGVTVGDLEAENPAIKPVLRIGETITIPKQVIADSETQNTNTDISIPEEEEEVVEPLATTSPEAITTNTPIENVPESTVALEGLLASMDKSKTNKVLLGIPFTEKQFQSYTDNPIKYITLKNATLKQGIEYYRGAKLAVDSIKSLGLSLDVEVSDYKNGVFNAANTGKLESFNGIIIPSHFRGTEDIAHLLLENNTPVITSYAETTKGDLNNLYEAIASPSLQRATMLHYLKLREGNIVVVSDPDKEESNTVIETTTPGTKFINLKDNGTFNQNELINLLESDKTNYVVFDSNKSNALIGLSNTLLGETGNFDIQLAILEQSLMPDANAISPKRLRVLKMLYPTFSNDRNSMPSNTLIDSYKKTYKTEISENVILGFDITFDSLLRLFQTHSFNESVQQKPSEHIYMTFEYKKSVIGRYNNNSLNINQYDIDYVPNN